MKRDILAAPVVARMLPYVSAYADEPVIGFSPVGNAVLAADKQEAALGGY